MISALRHGRLLAWLVLLLAGLGPVHAFLDEALESCSAAQSGVHGHEHGHQPDRNLAETEPCHEHCAIGRGPSPSRTSFVAGADFPLLPPSVPEPMPLGDPRVVGPLLVRPESPRTTSSPYHQRVGLRLYA